MKIFLFLAIAVGLGFLAGMLVGRWAHKRDRIAKLQMGFDPAAPGSDRSVKTVYQNGKLIGVLKL